MSQIDVQYLCSHPDLPSPAMIRKVAKHALNTLGKIGGMCVRVVDEEEGTALNEQFRREKKGPTNVLSFSYGDEVPNNYLGDIVICVPVVFQEAQEQQKSVRDHFNHLLVHGILHLLGYDHEEEIDANSMEKQEIAILASLNIANPYEEKTSI